MDGWRLLLPLGQGEGHVGGGTLCLWADGRRPRPPHRQLVLERLHETNLLVRLRLLLRRRARGQQLRLPRLALGGWAARVHRAPHVLAAAGPGRVPGRRRGWHSQHEGQELRRVQTVVHLRGEGEVGVRGIGRGLKGG